MAGGSSSSGSESADESARARRLLRRLVARYPRLLFTAVVGDGDDRRRHDPVQQIGLPRLERDQPAEHVEEVQEVLGIFGEPAVWLYLFERRGRPLVADQRL